ncbi:MAG: cbb3-type cytochrome oxidase assembly protein CcoS [Gammaproteobacteria bacterium]|nr:cbb3-type cytochrome oxidase assembly protein CcoS [Gammaproteobacteria bacterium]
MNIIFVLIPLSVVLVAVAVLAFLWAANNGQFDDLDTPARRILEDEKINEDKRVRQKND